MVEALRRHWPEYLFEALGLGLFMVSATVFGALLEHPASALRAAIDDPALRRAVMGALMGLTAVGLIYSPWGRRSGAHMNPAVTLAFWRLGKVEGADAVNYALAQTAGGLLGTLLAQAALVPAFGPGTARLVVTVPGPAGVFAAFAAEVAISFGLLFAVLQVSNRPRRAHLAGLVAGTLVGLWILIEAPLSGMSINPARSLATAIPAGDFTAFWIYLAAPPLGMLAAAEVFLHTAARTAPCAMLSPGATVRCIFRCGHEGCGAAAVPGGGTDV